MDRLLGIGEFAQLVGLSVSAVRFYADRGLLIPASIDPSSGYRSFQLEQVAAGSLIRDLRLIGVPLAQVREALCLSDAEVKHLVDAHIAGLEANLQDAQRTARRLSSAQETGSTPARTSTVEASDLIRAFEQVLPFASSNPEHPHLMTVLIEAKAGSVRIVTTDTHRLAVRDLVALDTGDDFTAVIPAATARRWLTELRPQRTVRLQLDGRSIIASDDEAAITAHVVPTDFPDYEQFLEPPEASTSIIVDRKGFLSAVQPFGETAGAVLLSAAQHHMRVRRRDLDVQIGGEQLGPCAHVAIDPAYAAEAAENALGAELVIEIGPDPLRPVFFRSATNGTFVSLLMPVELA